MFKRGSFAAILLVLLCGFRANAQRDVSAESFTSLTCLQTYLRCIDAPVKARIDVERYIGETSNKHLSLNEMCALAKRVGVSLSVRKVSFDQVCRSPVSTLVKLKSRDEYIVVNAVGSKYALLTTGKGTEIYTSPKEIERRYAGEMLTLSDVHPVIRVSEPVVVVPSKGVLSSVSASVSFRNVGNRTLHIVPSPCGCAGLPRGVVSPENVMPGQAATVRIDYAPATWGTSVQVVPISTNDPNCPRFYVGLMAVSPPGFHLSPASGRIDAYQNQPAREQFILNTPIGWTVADMSFADSRWGLRAGAIGNFANIDRSYVKRMTQREYFIDTTGRSPVGNYQATLRIQLCNKEGNAKKEILFPVAVTILPDVYLNPGDAFVGEVAQGKHIGITVSFQSHTKKKFKVLSVKVPKGVTAAITKSSSSGTVKYTINLYTSEPKSTFFRKEVFFILNDGTRVNFVITGIVG